MDVVQQFAIQLGITAPETFVVSGASKVSLFYFSYSDNRIPVLLAWMDK